MTCTKRAYASPSAARRAHRRAGWRVQVYVCNACRRYHVANDEKKRLKRRQESLFVHDLPDGDRKEDTGT